MLDNVFQGLHFLIIQIEKDVGRSCSRNIMIEKIL